MIQLYSTSWHQSNTETLVLLKHCLICSAYQILELLALTVYGRALPPYYLIRLPMSRCHILGIFTFHRAYLPLLTRILIFQRLKEPSILPHSTPSKRNPLLHKFDSTLAGYGLLLHISNALPRHTFHLMYRFLSFIIVSLSSIYESKITTILSK